MMNNQDSINYLIQFFVYIKDIVLGAIGGAVAYLMKYKEMKELSNSHKIQWSLLIVNMILGGFIASIVGDAIPTTMPYHNFIIGSVGVASYPLLVLVENSFAKILYEKITGTKLKDKDTNE